MSKKLSNSKLDKLKTKNFYLKTQKLVNDEFKKEAKRIREEADKEIDYQGGGAYKAFLKLFSNNIIEEREKKNEVNISDNTTDDDKL